MACNTFSLTSLLQVQDKKDFVCVCVCVVGGVGWDEFGYRVKF